ncbi:MAG: FIST N-terminal domain-containing protein [Rhodospirillales bacterium]
MTAFTVAHAIGEDWAHAAQSCADALDRAEVRADLAFLYVTDGLAEDMANILGYLRQRTGIAHWAGTVGFGICGNETEYVDCRAVAVMAMSLPPGSFRVFPCISETTAQLSAEDRSWIAAVAPPFGILHGDPHNARTPQLVADLGAETLGFLVGGLSSSRTVCHQVADRLTGGGVSGVLFAPDVAVQTGLSQGCTPVGGSHVISDALDNVVIGLDGRRAVDVFKEDIGDVLARDLARVAGTIHVAFPLPGSDTGDYLVRNLIGIDPVHGWLAIGDGVTPGDRVMFVRRDVSSARIELTAMLARLKRRLGAPPRGGIYFSCVARGANMFGRPGREVALIRDQLGELPLVGLACGGEISNGRLYGYTGVLALFT